MNCNTFMHGEHEKVFIIKSSKQSHHHQRKVMFTCELTKQSNTLSSPQVKPKLKSSGSVCPRMDGLPPGWMDSLASSDRTLSVTLLIITLSVKRSIAVSNAFNHNS